MLQGVKRRFLRSRLPHIVVAEVGCYHLPLKRLVITETLLFKGETV